MPSDDKKDEYMKRLERLGLVKKQPAPARKDQPIIIAHQGHGGAGASSGGAGGASGGGSGGSGAGGGGTRTVEDPRSRAMMQAALQALQRSKQDATKKKLTRASAKQKTTARKRYNAVRKEKLKNISTRQKLDLKKITAHLKTLPKGRRVAEGKKLRAAVRERYKKMKERLPSATGKSLSEIATLEKGAKSLRL